MRFLPTLTVCACCALLTTAALAGPDHSHHAPKEKAAAKQATIAYTLNTCAVSGEALGSMGDAIVKVYEGREVKFCCSMCVPKFEKDLKASFKKLDEQIIKSQIAFYPTTECLVSGEPLAGADGMDTPIDFVYNGRLIRLCCRMCRGDFKDNPEKFIAKLDQAVIAQQSEHYPLTNCPISDQPLGSMGDAINVVYAGRLVKFCCSMCIPRFEKDPMATIEKIDAAWTAMHKDSHNHTGHDGHSHDHGG